MHYPKMQAMLVSGPAVRWTMRGTLQATSLKMLATSRGTLVMRPVMWGAVWWMLSEIFLDDLGSRDSLFVDIYVEIYVEICVDICVDIYLVRLSGPNTTAICP